MTTLEIQRALKLRGFDPGPIDGIWGRKTIAAVKAFQKARGLAVDGIVGPMTRAALYGAAADHPAELPPWYEEARRLAGLKEIAGRASNPVILSWARRLGGWIERFYIDDGIPWCGLFAAQVLGATLPEEPLPGNPFGARNWLLFGRGLERPALGAIAVFWRGSRSGWQGHVGFYAGEDASAIHVLGGNQSNAVNVTRIARDRLLGYRWPRTYPIPSSGAVKLSANGKLSANEA